MNIQKSALENGIARASIINAVDHAVMSAHAGDGPTKILVVGPDASGEMIEVFGIIRNADILFVHAIKLRPEIRDLLDARMDPAALSEVTNASCGMSADGFDLTDKVLNGLIEGAQQGHDFKFLHAPRSRPGRPAPFWYGADVPVGLPAPLLEAVQRRAGADKTSAQDVISAALENYVKAHT